MRVGAPTVLTSVPPVGPKNLDTPWSDIDSMPKAVTTSDEGAVSILSAVTKSSSSSIFRFFVLLSERSGWGSFEDLAWMMASASSSWWTRSLILAIRRWRCSVAARTKLDWGESVCAHTIIGYTPSALAGGEAPCGAVSIQETARTTV